MSVPERTKGENIVNRRILLARVGPNDEATIFAAFVVEVAIGFSSGFTMATT